MRRRPFTTRWLGACGVILLVGCVGPGAVSAQSPLDTARQLAAQGDVAAQYHLGYSYDYGLGVPEDDTRALEWYRIAADQGHAAAQHHLGYLYATGQGVQQDFAEAIRWYRQAAAQGYTTSRYHLSGMYARGEGVPEDEEEAIAWFRQAADEGDIPAQYMLGFLFSEGVRTEPPASRRPGGPARGIRLRGRRSADYVEAHRWFNLAASHVSITGDERRFYAGARNEIAKWMSADQIEEAQRLAREWQEDFDERQDARALGTTPGSRPRAVDPTPR